MAEGGRRKMKIKSIQLRNNNKKESYYNDAFEETKVITTFVRLQNKQTGKRQQSESVTESQSI